MGLKSQYTIQKKKEVTDLNKPSKLPSTSDLVISRDFLLNEMKESEEIITTNTDPSAWSHLAKATMCRLILRVTDPSGLQQAKYEESLTDMENIFAKR